MKHDRTPNPEEAKAAKIPDAVTTTQWNPSRREIVVYGVIAVVLVAAVASCTVLAAESGAFNPVPAPTPTPENPENYAIDHDRYSTNLSNNGYSVLCYSNGLPSREIVGTEFEVTIPSSNTFCEDVQEGTIFDTRPRTALGIPGNPVNGTIDIFVTSVTTTDRTPNPTTSPSR